MILEKLKRVIAEQLGVDADIITMETHFEDDLGVDSLDIVELTMAMEEEFNLEEMSEEDLAQVVTVGDLVRYLQQKLDI
ncbi:MAG: Acyl carrier protein [Firmicutes bacterium]|nr:Acyl carrier protein [Bacillota bacterium]